MLKIGRTKPKKYWKRRYVEFLSTSHSELLILLGPPTKGRINKPCYINGRCLRTTSIISDYDIYRQTLVASEDDEGWAAELRHYLKDMPADVMKETDIVEWWQVSLFKMQMKFTV
jgi:hypothetical protein